MRILLLSNNYVDRSRGGVELHVYNLGKALIRAGHDVTVGRTSGGEPLHETDGARTWILGSERRGQRLAAVSRGSSLPVIRLASNFIERLRIGRSVAKQLLDDPERLKQYDVIHHHDFITSSVISRFLRHTGVRQVWTNHLGEFLILSRIPIVGKVLTRHMTSYFAQATGPSAELAEQSAVACPISYVPNGVDVRAFSPRTLAERIRMRGLRQWGDKGLLIVVPRRWAPSKGVIYAARAQASSEWPKDSLTIYVGAGESDVPEYAQAVRTQLEKSLSPFQVIDSVTPSEMSEILGVADVCVIPSLLEATSLSALEAMSSGLCVVASDIGGLPDLIVNGQTGYLVPAQDPDAIARRVKSVSLLPRNEAEEICNKARKSVEDHYSWDSIVKQISRMYGEVAR